MPKGFEAAKKVGGRRGGYGFMPRPIGVTFFSLKMDGESAKVRFIDQHNDIDWVRKWRMPPSANFQYGELVNAVDQYEDGTPDPGYSAGLRSRVNAYPLLIWRNAPVYQRDPQGKLVTDSNNQKIVVGHADQLAIWECSFQVYQQLQELDKKLRDQARQSGMGDVGLPLMDFEVTRKGTRTDTQYMFFPEGVPGPFSPQDQQIIAQHRQTYTNAIAMLTKIPTAEQLARYINEGVSISEQEEQGPQQPMTIQQQVTNNAIGLDGDNPFLSAA